MHRNQNLAYKPFSGIRTSHKKAPKSKYTKKPALAALLFHTTSPGFSVSSSLKLETTLKPLNPLICAKIKTAKGGTNQITSIGLILN
jgi:hypothetical protein